MKVKDQRVASPKHLATAGRWRPHVVEFIPGLPAPTLDRHLKSELLRKHGLTAEIIFQNLGLFLAAATIIDDFATHEARRKFRMNLHTTPNVPPEKKLEEEVFRKENRLRQNYLVAVWTSLEAAKTLLGLEVEVDLEELREKVQAWDDTTLQEKLTLVEELEDVCLGVFTEMSEETAPEKAAE